VAIARYNAEYGLTGQPSASSEQFKAWRRRQITDWLRATYADILAVKPNMRVEAAVFSDQTDAYSNRFQDWGGWMNEKLLDSLVPMNYGTNNTTFNSRADNANAKKGERFCYMGQGAYLNTKENTATQLLYARSIGCNGLITYSYRATNSAGDSNSVFYTYIKDNVFTSAMTVPQMSWKTTPTGGYLRGRVTDASTGMPIYNATVTISELGLAKKTDGEGKYAFIYITPGTYTVTASATGYDPLQYTGVVVTAGQVTTRNFAMGSPDSDGDGIADSEEDLVPSATGSSIQPTGDANRDNILDSQQTHVTSFANAKDGRYITLVATSGLSFHNVI